MFPEPTIRPLPLKRIRPDNTALLVIDMERDFVDKGAVLQTPGGLEIVPVINELARWARENSLPVIWTHEMHRPDRTDYGIELEFDPIHCVEGTPGCEITEGLEVAPTDHHLRSKRRYDCFCGTELDVLLRSMRIENLVCCGVTTHCCVMATVYTARSLDYRVLVPRDAVAAITPEHNAAALICMSEGFAYISDSEQITGLFSSLS